MNTRWIDGHLDLAYVAVTGRDIRVPAPNPSAGCVSLPALREAAVEIAFGTIFTAPGEDGPDGYESSEDLDAAAAAGEMQLAVYEQLEEEGEITIVRSRDDLAGDGTLPRVVLLMEGADPIRSPEYARRWLERGLRMVGLTWARGTRYAGGNASGGPLTSLGRDLIVVLDELGMIHDASHLSDAALDGVLEHARGPIVATHSNCRALMDANERHLRDDQIRAIEARGGIVGLNLYSKFLASGRRATIADCVAHMDHVAEVMGHRRGVALGSDMDGGFGPELLPEGLNHPMRLNALAEALRSGGWSDEDVDGFCYANWLRFLTGALA